MAPLGASSITTALEQFRYNNFNAFVLRSHLKRLRKFKLTLFVAAIAVFVAAVAVVAVRHPQIFLATHAGNHINQSTNFAKFAAKQTG
jgi:cell division protein FtsL